MKARAEIEFDVSDAIINMSDEPLSHRIHRLLEPPLNVKTVCVTFEEVERSDTRQIEQLKSLVDQLGKSLDKINLSIAKLRIKTGFQKNMETAYYHLGIFNKQISGLYPELNHLTVCLDKLGDIDDNQLLLGDPTKCPHCQSKII